MNKHQRSEVFYFLAVSSCSSSPSTRFIRVFCSISSLFFTVFTYPFSTNSLSLPPPLIGWILKFLVFLFLFSPATAFPFPVYTMFHSRRSPLKAASSNPFDSDDEGGRPQMHNSSRRTSSEPKLYTPDFSNNPFDDDYEGKEIASSLYLNSLDNAARNKYKNDFRDSGGLENQSVQELENYAVYKAEETTKTANNCLKIAEDIREDATKTLVALHHQGEQISRTHDAAADIDHDLSRGEKLLGSLGGIFSKTWKPKKNRPITGPVITRDEVQRKGNHLEQREKLSLASVPKRQSHSTPPPEPTNALEKVEVEKGKQDDAMSDLSNLLGELKDMAVDMGSEIDRQGKALDHMYGDVDELNFRVKQASQRGRRLLGK